MEHLNYPIVAKTHTPMYLIHKFWARKPHNVVKTYIETYSKEGDIVLDPFCGSGPTALEALKLGRKAVAVDLNPMATFITRVTAVSVESDQITEAYREIERAARGGICSLYLTECPRCKGDAEILATIYDGSTPVSLWFLCSSCEEKAKKELTQGDINRLEEIERMEIPHWFPRDRFYYPNGSPFVKKEKCDSVDELFTKRNLVALSILWHEIEELARSNTKDIMRLIFTSLLAQVSKMVPRRKGDTLSGNVGWTVPSYWVPPGFREFNVWNSFESRYRKILKGKMYSNEEIRECKIAGAFEDLRNGANMLVKTHNALELTELVPPNSVDYVFADPPYGGSIQYLELSTLWSSWLHRNGDDEEFNLRYKDEITVNKSQSKDFDYYHKMLRASFEQVFRVLKPSKWLTVTFHSTSIKVWNSIIGAVILAGFELEKIIYQPPAQISVKALSQPYGSAVGDYYIRFRKPEKARLATAEGLDERRYERIVIKAAKRIIAERGEPTIYQHILNGIMVELQREGALLLGERDIRDVMKSHLDDEFTLEPVRDGDKVVGHKWWLKNPSSVPYLERVPLHERIETVVIDELNRRVILSFDDILQSLFMKFPNALTPETHGIRAIMKEYAEKAEKGKWRLKPDVRIRMGEHGKMVFYLLELGKKAGYKVWAAPGGGSMFKGKSLYSQNEKRPLFRFIPSDHQDKVKQIDVLWYEDGEIRYEFEVENTTTITEAVTRGSYIPYETVKRFIVIPEERENLLYQKLEQPLIMKNVMESKWAFITYKDLENIYGKSKRKKRVDSNAIDAIARMPKLRRQVQSDLAEFVEW